MITALYTRVSTEQQVDKESLSTQKALLESYCKTHDFQDFLLYEETGKSAKDTNRPALSKLLQDIRSGKVNSVVVTRLDRITRSIVDLWELIREFHEHNVEFVSLAERIDTEGPAGRFLANILGSLAQFEREIIAKRVTESMHYRALQGKWNGGPVPYGYTTQGRLQSDLKVQGKSNQDAASIASEIAEEPKKLYPDESEADIVKKVFNIYVETRSIRETTRRLNAEGLKTRNDANWSTTTVSRILKNPLYVGKIQYGKRKTNLDNGKIEKADKDNLKVAEGVHEGIISQSLFETVQEILTNTSQKPRNQSRTYLLSGLLICGKCGRKMHGHAYNKPNGANYSWYKCPKKRAYEDKDKCEGLTIPAKRLEDFVAETLKNLSQNTTFLADKEKMLNALREEVEAVSDDGNDELKRLKKEEKNLEGRREKLLDALERGVIEDSVFKERYDKIKNLLENNRLIQEKHQSKVENKHVLKECLEASFEEIASFEKNWNVLDDEGKAALLQTVVKQIEVTEDDINFQIYLDNPFSSVDAVSRTGKDSWRR